MSENPCVDRIKPYKKTLMRACQKLTMLDDMTISDVERLKIEKERGEEFETEILESKIMEKLDSAKWQSESTAESAKIFDRAQKDRAEAYMVMMDELSSLGSDLPVQFRRVKEKQEELDEDSPEGKDNYRKMLEIEQEMKSQWFARLKGRGDEVPTCMGRSMF